MKGFFVALVLLTLCGCCVILSVRRLIVITFDKSSSQETTSLAKQ